MAELIRLFDVRELNIYALSVMEVPSSRPKSKES